MSASPAASSRSLIVGIVAVAAVLLGIGAGTYFLGPSPGAATLSSGTLLPKPRAVPAFSLTGEDGQPYTREALRGRWTLIFVGYTHCPDVCPTTLATLKSVKQNLGTDAGKLGVLFLSIDPARDTPAHLAEYVHYFGTDFRAATGSDEALQALGKQLGYVYFKSEGKTPDSYTMDHSAALMLINPQAELAGYLSPPFDAATIARDLKPLLEKAA